MSDWGSNWPVVEQGGTLELEIAPRRGVPGENRTKCP